jgi:anhydro-N-acetylmuramic acid kinase
VKKAQLESGTTDITIHDLLSTLTRFSAETIAEAIIWAVGQTDLANYHIYLSGGGMHNPLLVDWLKELIPANFYQTDVLGINGDAKEAVLFAILANETVAGGMSDFGSRKGIPSVAMGKISFPS